MRTAAALAALCAAGTLTSCAAGGSASGSPAKAARATPTAGSMAGMSMPNGSSMAPAVSAGPEMSMAGDSSAEPPTVTVGAITLSGAQVKLPVTPDETVGYLTITNAGAADQLVGASSPDAQSVELHTTTDNGSVETMEMANSIPIPAHATVAFALGGLHLMLMQPKVSLGVRVPLLLRFRDAGVVTVWAQVSRYGTDEPAASVSAQ